MTTEAAATLSMDMLGKRPTILATLERRASGRGATADHVLA
jgi:hypothetical protein